MKHGFLLLLCLAACRQATPSTRTAAPQAAQAKTIDTTPPPQAAAGGGPLPFSPAIALDPVSGQKISIRATTPTAELKGRMYYFESEENKRTFIANPVQYQHGVFALPKG